MKSVILSHLRYHADRFEKDAIKEREFLQTTLDLIVERLVDLDQGRDDECITGSYERSEFANVLVEAEMMNSQPPTARGSLPPFPSSIPAPSALASGSIPSIEIRLDASELDEDDGPVCPRISCLPPPMPVRPAI